MRDQGCAVLIRRSSTRLWRWPTGSPPRIAVVSSALCLRIRSDVLGLMMAGVPQDEAVATCIAVARLTLVWDRRSNE